MVEGGTLTWEQLVQPEVPLSPWASAVEVSCSLKAGVGVPQILVHPPVYCAEMSEGHYSYYFKEKFWC